MDGQNETRKRLASLLNEVAVHEGTHRTLVEGVQVTRRSQSSPRTPVVYQPNIIVVGQGQKRGHLGDKVYLYDQFNHAEYAKPISAEEMARRAGMSVSAFHHNFKLVTACSPLQYLKRIRLDQASRLMAHDGYNASTAARSVGYESPSQFSREFKRLFGVTPVEEAEHTRARLIAV